MGRKTCISLLATTMIIVGAISSAATELTDILEFHIEALGGREALSAITSVSAYSTLDYMGVPGRQTTHAEFPLRVYMEIDLAGSKQVMACDDFAGWSTDPNGITRRLGLEEIRPLINDLYFSSYSYALPGLNPGRVEYRGDTVINEAAYYRLDLYPESGDSLTIFVNSASGLVDYRVELLTGLETITRYFDYRELAGVKVPYRAEIEIRGAQINVFGLVDSAQVNPRIPDSVFRMPGREARDFSIGGGGDSAVIPFHLEHNHLLVDVFINGSGPFRFLLDSGAAGTMISTKVADRLGIEREGEIFVRGVGGFGSTFLGGIDSLTIGQLSLYLRRIAIFDFSSLPGPEFGKLDGILGYDFFARLPMAIDFDEGALTVYNPETKTRVGGGEAIETEIYFRLPVVTAQLNGRPIRLAVDLGAQAGIFVRSHAGAYKELEEKYKSGSRTVISGVGGSHTVTRCRLDSLVLGSVRVDNPTVLVSSDFMGMPFPDYIEGLIGVEILRQFEMYIDYRSGEMYLE